MKKMQNWVKRGHVGSRDPILEFWDSPNISPTVEARNFKFGTETGRSKFKQKKSKIGSKGVMWGSRDPLLEFWDNLISCEPLKLATSNLAGRRTAVSSNEKMQNWVKGGHEGVT